MPNHEMTLSQLTAAQRDFDAARATTFAWSSEITATDIRPLIHNALSLAGEAGEIANIVKKLERGDIPFKHAMRELPGELADVLIYIMKIAYQSRIDLTDAVEQKMLINSRRFPASAQPHYDDSPSGRLLQQAATRASEMNDQDAAALADIYIAEGVRLRAKRHELVAGGMLALRLAKLATIESNDDLRDKEWALVAPAAEQLFFTNDDLRVLARHDLELSRLMDPRHRGSAHPA